MCVVKQILKNSSIGSFKLFFQVKQVQLSCGKKNILEDKESIMAKKKGRLLKKGKAYQKVEEDGPQKKKRGGRKNKKDKKKISCGDYELRQRIKGGPNGKREIVEMESDGNCLFRSISHQLQNDYGENHDEVRHEICNYLEENKEDFSIFLLLDDEEEDVMDFDEYVAEMRDDATWGGDVEIVCAARLYKRQITIFSASGAYNIGIGDEKTTGPDLLLSYHENSHYNSVEDADANSLHANEHEQKQDKSDPVDKENGDAEINESASDSLPSKDNRRPAPKNNDLCHCGSKRKYKKCCLAIEKSRIRSEKFQMKKNSVESTSEDSTDDSQDEQEMMGSFNILTI